MWARAALLGMASGVAGTAVMTLAEQVEQRLTRRPDSFVPSRTLQRLLGRARPRDDWALNHAMHWGTGISVGALRGIMAAAGLRGPWASAMFCVVRLTTDQTLENATGVGSPPWTWPRDELVVDVGHKAVYAFATGAVADALTGRRA
jgi:hypothetical protein